MGQRAGKKPDAQKNQQITPDAYKPQWQTVDTLSSCLYHAPHLELFKAQVAELVDALASGASVRNGVEVRVFSWAPNSEKTGQETVRFFYACFLCLIPRRVFIWRIVPLRYTEKLIGSVSLKGKAVV